MRSDTNSRWSALPVEELSPFSVYCLRNIVVTKYHSRNSIRASTSWRSARKWTKLGQLHSIRSDHVRDPERPRRWMRSTRTKEYFPKQTERWSSLAFSLQLWIRTENTDSLFLVVSRGEIWSESDRSKVLQLTASASAGSSIVDLNLKYFYHLSNQSFSEAFSTRIH